MSALKFNNFTNRLGRLLYPWSCQICHGSCGERAGICANCYPMLPWCEASCAVCGLPIGAELGTSTICGVCQQRKPYFDRLFAPLWYEAPINEFIVNLKYSNKWENISLLMELFLNTYSNPRPDALLLSVPSHSNRIRTRGFSPVQEILRELRRSIKIEYRANALKRIRATETQTGKTKRERRRNVNKAFEVTQNLRGKNIVLFDDVVTTGATVNELSRCLKKQGVTYVEVWAIARTKRNINN